MRQAVTMRNTSFENKCKFVSERYPKASQKYKLDMLYKLIEAEESDE